MNADHTVKMREHLHRIEEEVKFSLAKAFSLLPEAKREDAHEGETPKRWMLAKELGYARRNAELAGLLRQALHGWDQTQATGRDLSSREFRDELLAIADGFVEDPTFCQDLFLAVAFGDPRKIEALRPKNGKRVTTPD